MANITAAYIDEQIGYLRTEHEFIIVYDEEFGGSPADIPELRRLLRRAAKAAGMRVHTRVYDDDALTVFDPDWNPTPAERAAFHREQDERRRAARHELQHQQEVTSVRPVRHLRPLN
jgi:hypothetical protein